MREPSCGNDRALNQPTDSSSTFPGVSHFAVLCLQLSQYTVLEFVLVSISGWLSLHITHIRSSFVNVFTFHADKGLCLHFIHCILISLLFH